MGMTIQITEPARTRMQQFLSANPQAAGVRRPGGRTGERNVNQHAPALDHRAQGSSSRRQPRDRVGEGVAQEVRLACDPSDDPAGDRRVVAEADARRRLAGPAVAGHRDPDEARVLGEQVRRIEAEGGEGAGPCAGHQHVCSDDGVAQLGLAGGIGEIHSHLPRVQRQISERVRRAPCCP